VPDPRPPLLLLPPSKGKAPGGQEPAYRESLRGDGPLDPSRRELLDRFLADLPGLDDAALARVTGVRAAKVEAVRADAAELDRAPTLPAHERYTGVVHGNAGLAELDPARVGVEVRIVSALLGLAGLDELVPAYRLEFAASLPSLGGVATFWRRRSREHLAELTADRTVWDLLPGEHRRIWDPDVRAGVRDLVDVAFVRPDGRPANAARTKVAKGRLAAHLLGEPGLTPSEVARTADLGEGWQLVVRAGEVVATYTG
jgi:uncharacterized protein